MYCKLDIPVGLATMHDRNQNDPSEHFTSESVLVSFLTPSQAL